MVYFERIAKTLHYIEHHERGFPLIEVVQAIHNSPKSMKKVGDMLEINNDKYYILCKLQKNTIYVINAKKK